MVGESLECGAVEMLMIFSHCGRFSVTQGIICCTVPYINVGYSSGCLWRFKIITDADHGRTCRNYVLEVRAVC